MRVPLELEADSECLSCNGSGIVKWRRTHVTYLCHCVRPSEVPVERLRWSNAAQELVYLAHAVDGLIAWAWEEFNKR